MKCNTLKSYSLKRLVYAIEFKLSASAKYLKKNLKNSYVHSYFTTKYNFFNAILLFYSCY